MPACKERRAASLEALVEAAHSASFMFPRLPERSAGASCRLPISGAVVTAEQVAEVDETAGAGRCAGAALQRAPKPVDEVETVSASRTPWMELWLPPGRPMPKRLDEVRGMTRIIA